MSTTVLESAKAHEARARWMRFGLTIKLVTWISQALEKRGSRRTLAELTRDQLDDIGISPSEARTEREKSWFWD